MGLALWMSAHVHSMSAMGLCCFLLSSSFASFVSLRLVLLAAFAASAFATLTMPAAERTGLPFRCLVRFLASSLSLTLASAFCPAAWTISLSILFLCWWRVSGPCFGCFDDLRFFGAFLAHTVRLASVLFSASSGIPCSHSSWASFRVSQMLFAVRRWSMAASLIIMKAVMWPTLSASFATAVFGTIPSRPHMFTQSGGWFESCFQFVVSQFSPSSSHSCHNLRSSASHSCAALVHVLRACSTVSFAAPHAVHLPSGPMCFE